MSNDGIKLRLNGVLKDVKKASDNGGGERNNEHRMMLASLEQRKMELDAEQRALWEKEARIERREQEVEARAEKLENEIVRLGELFASAHREKIAALEKNEEELVALALAVTRKALQHEIENGRYKIGEIVKGTLAAVRKGASTAVKVNPEDAEAARAAIDALDFEEAGKSLRIVEDESIPPAACGVETESGCVYSDVEGRLKVIEQNLLQKT